MTAAGISSLCWRVSTSLRGARSSASVSPRRSGTPSGCSIGWCAVATGERQAVMANGGGRPRPRPPGRLGRIDFERREGHLGTPSRGEAARLRRLPLARGGARRGDSCRGDHRFRVAQLAQPRRPPPSRACVLRISRLRDRRDQHARARDRRRRPRPRASRLGLREPSHRCCSASAALVVAPGRSGTACSSRPPTWSCCRRWRSCSLPGPAGSSPCKRRSSR